MWNVERRRFVSLAFGAAIGWASMGWIPAALAGTVELAQATRKLNAIGKLREMRLSGFGTLPGCQRVAMSVQDAVYLNEVVETIAGGAMRIRFGDATSLQIGAESEVTFDEYVYGWFRRSKMTLTLSKGVFRLATGRMSKNAYSVVTSTATISIRGTDFLATVSDNTIAIDLYAGKLEVQDTRNGNAAAAVIVLAGQSVTLGPTNAAPVIGLASPPTDPALAKSFKDADGDELAVEFVGEDR